MMDDARARVPGWYWAVAILALLWEAGGCYSYLMKVGMSAADFAALPPAEREVWLALPAWVTGAFAAAVWVGLSGAVALLLRRRWARQAFIVSLVATVIEWGWIFLQTPILTTIGPRSAALPAAILVVGMFLIWFAGMAARRGWLR